MAEVLIESGLRWAELIELRPADFNPRTRMLTGSRVAVELVAKLHPTGGRFLIKIYPKHREHRHVKLAAHIADQLHTHITEHGLQPHHLLFAPTLFLAPDEPFHLQLVAGPVNLGLTEPNAAGRQYRHGTLTGHNPGGCKCDHCRGVIATYCAERRAAGKDQHTPAPDHAQPHPDHRRAHPAPLVPRRHLESRPRHHRHRHPGLAPTTCATPTHPGTSPAAPTSKPSKNDSDTAA